MLREVFGCPEPTKDNIYYTSRSLQDLSQGVKEPERARARMDAIREIYAGLSAVYQAGEKKMVLK
ncbi:MAG: nucleoside deaminase, partial [Synergistaceae bacterium]|nr:nucleoside deaminase [Synergistaceae bacterium]